MKQPVKWLVALLAIALLITSAAIVSPKRSDAFSDQIVKVGAQGKDVREMQGRLKYLGFYTGKVDGVFGWRTYWALRNFQYEFGLKVDGVLGPKTKLKLYNATKNWRPTAEELGVPQTAKTPSKSKAPTYHAHGIGERHPSDGKRRLRRGPRRTVHRTGGSGSCHLEPHASPVISQHAGRRHL